MGIRRAQGSLDVTTEAIAKHFHSFYTDLYNLPQQHRRPDMIGDRTQIIRDYLKNNGLPSLDALHANALEFPKDSMEIREAIKHLKLGKSPDPDGFTAIYYKTFVDLQTDPLTLALNSLSRPREVTPDLLSAFITVVPKPGKDPSICASYRPISLLNLDIKIFAKILANRLRPHLQQLIGPEQVGFMPIREAKDNVIKPLLLTHSARMHNSEGLLLSTDAEKAIDRVAWDYMLATCSHVGLGSRMLAWISALY